MSIPDSIWGGVDLKVLIVPALFVGFFGKQIYQRLKSRIFVPKLLERGAVIVDVRSAEEFAQGCNYKSKNMPLGRLQRDIKSVSLDTPVIVCCASGIRSASAAYQLRRLGYQEVFNAGPWRNTIIVE